MSTVTVTQWYDTKKNIEDSGTNDVIQHSVTIDAYWSQHEHG